MADRYAYIPFIGLFVMCTWLAADWITGRGRGDDTRSLRSTGIPATGLAIAAVLYLIGLGILTYHQTSYWHDSESFWQRTLALTKNNYVAHDTLGEYLADKGEPDAAAAHFRAALDIRPDDLPANLNLATLEANRGNLQGAIERYRFVALHAADPDLRAAAFGNLGTAYRELNEPAEAKECFESALQLDPKRSMAMIGLGLIAQKSNDLSEAVRQYSRAMAIEPTDVGYLLLANALEQTGQAGEAQAIREKVARLSPNLAEAEREAESLLAGK
jgi:tetratricopeptide (TPR) repeat protein